MYIHYVNFRCYAFLHILGIVALIITLLVVFIPVYLVLGLPCVLFQMIRKGKSGENVVKKFFNMDDGSVNGAENNEVDEKNGGCDVEGIPLTNDHLKSKLNTRRASSIEGENEIKGKTNCITQNLSNFFEDV